jgi:serine phosphatase RsbU (regulator of sigma subunit)
MEQFPLGLFPGAGYASRRFAYEPGDLFVLVTDGIVEAGEDRGADFGLESLGRILCEMADQPLSAIYGAMQSAVERYGAQHDDQTVLLVRARALEQ